MNSSIDSASASYFLVRKLFNSGFWLRLCALLTVFFSLTFISCKTKSGGQLERQESGDATSGNRSSGTGQDGLALLSEDEVIVRGKVHAIRLDSADFRVNALRVGAQTFYKYETPVVFFEMPKDSDYVEILRCPSDVIVHGGEDTIDDVEIGASSLDLETAIFARNNFWEAATSSPGCIMVASSYTDLSFEDTFSPTGEFNYYIRACVDEERLVGTRQFGTSHCSRLVSRSGAHKHVNKRSQDELMKLEKAASIRSRIDTINRRIVDKTMELNQKLYDCQQRHQVRVVSKEKHKAISGIIGGATALGIPAIAAMTGLRGRALIGSAVVGVGAATVLSSLYVTGSHTASGYPKDAPACYNSTATAKIAGQIRNQKGAEEADLGLLCSCAEALSAQTEIYTLAKDLKNQLEVQQSILGTVKADETHMDSSATDADPSQN